MINLERNEVSISLAGETRTLRATFTAIRAIERDLGKSIIKVVDDLGLRGDISVTDTATIIYRGLQGYGDTRLTLDQVGNALVQEGFTEKAASAAEFLRVALMGVSTVGKQTEVMEANA